MKNKLISSVFSTLLLSTISCSTKYEKFSDNEVLKLESATTNIPADGTTYSTISVKAGENATSANSVSFTTNLGKFSDGNTTISVAPDLERVATAQLKSDQPGTARIRASIFDVTVETNVVFDTAYPNYLTVTLGNGSITGELNASTAVTTTAYRHIGNPTNSLWLNYSALDSVGNNKGIFLNGLPTSTSDVATTNFYLTDPAFRGSIFIKASFIRNLDTVSTTSILTITP